MLDKGLHTARKKSVWRRSRLKKRNWWFKTTQRIEFVEISSPCMDCQFWIYGCCHKTIELLRNFAYDNTGGFDLKGHSLINSSTKTRRLSRAQYAPFVSVTKHTVHIHITVCVCSSTCGNISSTSQNCSWIETRFVPPAPALPVFDKHWICLESDYMQPFQWCNGCLCGLGLQHSDCDMSEEDIYRLPLNVYVIVLGIGMFIFMLSVIFCCYLFRLKQQGTREQYSYNEVVLKGAGKKLSLLGQPCAVCLEEFKTRDELGVCPCSHTFHKKCLLKWLEIRSVCPMCNKPIMRLQNADTPRGAEGVQDPEEVWAPKTARPTARLALSSPAIVGTCHVIGHGSPKAACMHRHRGADELQTRTFNLH